MCQTKAICVDCAKHIDKAHLVVVYIGPKMINMGMVYFFGSNMLITSFRYLDTIQVTGHTKNSVGTIFGTNLTNIVFKMEPKRGGVLFFKYHSIYIYMCTFELPKHEIVFFGIL